jgi:hypothetical protein
MLRGSHHHDQPVSLSGSTIGHAVAECNEAGIIRPYFRPYPDDAGVVAARRADGGLSPPIRYPDQDIGIGMLKKIGFWLIEMLAPGDKAAHSPIGQTHAVEGSAIGSSAPPAELRIENTATAGTGRAVSSGRSTIERARLERNGSSRIAIGRDEHQRQCAARPRRACYPQVGAPMGSASSCEMP